MKPQSPGAVARLATLLEKLPALASWLEQKLTGLENLVGRTDVKNKLALYETASEALASHCGVQRGAAQAWLLDCLQESDPAVRECLGSTTAVSAEAAHALAQALIGLEATFQLVPGSTSRWQRDLKVYLVSGETPKRHRRLEELDWSELPDEVREKRLRDGSAELTFVLFPHAPRRTP